MEVKYTIIYQDEVKKHIKTLSVSTKELIKRVIEERLIIDPISFGKPLRYSLKGLRRLRVSNYRIVYKIDTAINAAIIISITHR